MDALLFNSNDSDESKLEACERDLEELGAVGVIDSLFGAAASASAGVAAATKQELLDDSLEELLDDMMIQTPNMPFQHPRSVMPPNYGPHSANNLFQSPYYHHHPHHPHHPHHHHVSSKIRGREGV